MKREQLSQIFKKCFNYTKQALLELPDILRERGGERFAQYTLAFLLLSALIINYVCGYYAYKGKQEYDTIKSAQINGISIPVKYVGRFSISHYCSCPICTGTAKGSKTATGHIPKEGRTVAVDKSIIPLHSVIYVEGLGTFVAEDVGGAVKGNHLDIYIDDHQRALNLGTLKGATPRVYILQ